MQALIDDIAEAIRKIDQSNVPFKQFQPGAGPYGEPQLTKLVCNLLAAACEARYEGIRTCRTPDVLIPGRWALESKIVRPYGDNGVEAEHWSQNLLHPYPGNVSALGDALKLKKYPGPERRGIVAILFEHAEPRVDLSILLSAFELVGRQLLRLNLGDRHMSVVNQCVHPVHARAIVCGWEILAYPASSAVE